MTMIIFDVTLILVILMNDSLESKVESNKDDLVLISFVRRTIFAKELHSFLACLQCLDHPLLLGDRYVGISLTLQFIHFRSQQFIFFQILLLCVFSV
jgi:hypothetical protein